MNKASTKSQKVLLFSDIHGNLPALEAVFDDVRSEPIDDVWNLGDITGYVPFPVRVVELLDRRQVVSIIGNYDRKVLAFKDCQDQRLSSGITNNCPRLDGGFSNLCRNRSMSG
ncbi:MAG: metallophosphoesterase family protein [Planctomycetota bacterium]|jgi:predicted phosphodiesterase